AVVEHRLVGLFGVDVQPLVGERGQRENGLAAAVLEGEERGPLAEALAIVVLGEERHRDFPGDPVEGSAHGLIALLRALDPALQLTVSRISRTLFFRVSMNVVACPWRMPPMGPLSSAAAAPPEGTGALPDPPSSEPARADAALARLPVREVPPCPCVPPPIRLRSWAGSSRTSGRRISALQA